MLEAAAQEIYLLGDTERATRIQQDAVTAIHEAAGNDRAAANARIWLGRYIWLLGDPDGGGAAECPGRRGSREVRAEPGAGDGATASGPRA